MHIDEIDEYSELYYKTGKSDKELEIMEKLEEKMRKAIAKAFSSDKIFKSLFGQDIIKKILPEYLSDEGEKETIRMFENFTT